MDVDSDNGGILLNLSESGLALQAVAPFAGLTRVTLRIQPPKPRKRLDLNAEITWLSESKKEAGLQFLELADDARVEIANWISAEGGAGVRSVTGDSLALQTAQASLAQFPEELPPRRAKWSFLVENSLSQNVPANPKIPNPAFGRRHPELHTDAILREWFPEIPARSPDSSAAQIHARTGSPNAPPDGSITFSQHVSGATRSPSFELSPPPPAIAAAAQAMPPVAPAPTLQAPTPAPIVPPPPAPTAGFIARRAQTPDAFISASSEKFPRSGERRRLPRRRIYSLAYLEVGSDNGGMVLDLSEYGLALQAFNPLIGLTRVNLRIQPPKSRKKIVATAEITWLSESQTEAGLRFLDLSDDARMEIADWISAEATAPEPPAADHSASRQAQIVSSAQASSAPVTEDRYHNWEGSFPLFDNSNPQEPLASQNVSRDFLNTSPDHGNVAFQPGSALSEKLSDHLAKDPNHSERAIGQARSIANQLTVAPSVSSAPVPDRSHPPLRLPAALTARSRLFASEQLRKWGTVATLSACVALVFLLLGMAISRGFLSDRATRLSAEEHARDAAASSTPPVTSATPVTPGRMEAPAGPAAFPTEASVSKTRQRDSASLSRPPQKDIRDKHNRENPKSRMMSDEVDPIAAALPPAIVPLQEAAISGSQNVALPSLPVWSVQAAGNHNLVAATPATNPAPPRAPERRSDCYLLYRVLPLYPREAREQRIEGTVVVHLRIGTDGHVRSSRELSGPAPLVPAALAAVREWRFIPALLNGQPIDTEKDVNIEFQLSR